MSRRFTAVGYWNDADEPICVAVVEGTDFEIGGGESCSEGGPWAIDVDAIDMASAESIAVDHMTDLGRDGYVEDTCDQPGCYNSLDDGEGYDGKCGDCADRIEAERGDDEE